MERLPSNTITEREITNFQDDGAICLRAAFSQRWIDLLRRGIEYNRLHPSDMTKRKGHSPLFFHDYNNWENIPEYKEFILHSPVGEIAGRLAQSAVSGIASFFCMQVVPFPVSNLTIWSSPISVFLYGLLRSHTLEFDQATHHCFSLSFI